jgi:hypothetical protein
VSSDAFTTTRSDSGVIFTPAALLVAIGGAPPSRNAVEKVWQLALALLCREC